MFFKVNLLFLLIAGLIGCATQQPMGSYQAVKLPDVSAKQDMINHAPNYRYVADSAHFDHQISTTTKGTNNHDESN